MPAARGTRRASSRSTSGSSTYANPNAISTGASTPRSAYSSPTQASATAQPTNQRCVPAGAEFTRAVVSRRATTERPATQRRAVPRWTLGA